MKQSSPKPLQAIVITADLAPFVYLIITVIVNPVSADLLRSGVYGGIVVVAIISSWAVENVISIIGVVVAINTVTDSIIAVTVLVDPVTTYIKGAKEAFIRVRDIYDSMSSEEKRLIDEEIVKVTGKIVKKSRKKK